MKRKIPINKENDKPKFPSPPPKTVVEKAPRTEELFCKLCDKQFRTMDLFNNHTQWKRHRELEDSHKVVTCNIPRKCDDWSIEEVFLGDEDNEADWENLDVEMNESFVLVNKSICESENKDKKDKTTERKDSSCELVLPSGIRIGHRSLFKYYRQTLSDKALELRQTNNHNVRERYNNIATATCTSADILKRRDIAYLQRWKSKMETKMQCRNNKLQMHFRPQQLNKIQEYK